MPVRRFLRSLDSEADERFENDGHPQLVDALRRQELVAGNDKLTDALIKHGELYAEASVAQN